MLSLQHEILFTNNYFALKAQVEANQQIRNQEIESKVLKKLVYSTVKNKIDELRSQKMQ